VFTYRRDGILIGCKYREVSKNFSQVCVGRPYPDVDSVILLSKLFFSYQEANTEKILYGLDDIKRAHDVIIVCSIFPILLSFILSSPKSLSL
jgi:twinkle protein